MHSPSQLGLDFLQFRSHSVTPTFTLQLVAAAPGLPADENETQECKGLRLALPASLPPGRCEASKFQHPGFTLVQFKSEFRESLMHLVPEASCIGLQLKPCLAISANVTGDFGIVTAGDRMLGCAAWIVLVSVNLSFRSTSFASRVCP